MSCDCNCYKISGDGLFNLGGMKRDNKKGFAPRDRRRIRRKGDKVITSIKIFRFPIMSVISKLLNLLTLGRLNRKMDKLNYEDLFHLGIIINNKFVLHKEEVPKFFKNENFIKENSNKEIEILNVPLPPDLDLTVEELINNTKNLMGSKFSTYDSVYNNCQVFVKSILDANNLNQPSLNAFVFQDIPKLLGKYKTLQKYANFVTDIGAVVNRAVFGNGY